MPERPRFPGKALLGWLATTGHLIMLGVLLGVFRSVFSKIGVVVFDLDGVVVIYAIYLARIHEWERIRSYQSAGERAQPQRKAGHVPASPRRQAAYRQVA